MKELIFNIKDYSLDLIKETSYLFSDILWVLIEKNDNKVKVSLELFNKRLNINDIRKIFMKRLDEEKIKNEIFEENIKFREYLIKQAMTYQPEKNDTDGLTQEEERELEKLIKEVEDELKKESGGSNDSEIKKTWEEKYGGKTSK
ncbi:MAG: hypothetical protein KA059_02975 [Elusimicrobiales bacterium]|nr:hypothetical protein [Elusimicrobiales bacterium]